MGSEPTTGMYQWSRDRPFGFEVEDAVAGSKNWATVTRSPGTHVFQVWIFHESRFSIVIATPKHSRQPPNPRGAKDCDSRNRNRAARYVIFLIFFFRGFASLQASFWLFQDWCIGISGLLTFLRRLGSSQSDKDYCGKQTDDLHQQTSFKLDVLFALCLGLSCLQGNIDQARWNHLTLFD